MMSYSGTMAHLSFIDRLAPHIGKYEALVWLCGGLCCFTALGLLAVWNDKASKIPFVLLHGIQGGMNVDFGGADSADVNITGAKRIKVCELTEFSTFNSTMCGLYEVVVTITKNYYDEDNRLWYTGCGWCKTGLHEVANTQYWCRKCEKYYSEGHLRYLFKMEIADHTGSHDVTISDEMGEKLLGCKANFLSELSKKDNSHAAINHLEEIQYICESRR